MVTSIARFIDVHYKPMLDVYKYHMAYVNVLGKHGCATRRREKPSTSPATMACAADYANKFQPNGFDSEFMTEGMSNDASVSMEGRSAKFRDTTGKLRDLFYCHIAEEKKQNAFDQGTPTMLGGAAQKMDPSRKSSELVFF